MDSAYAHISERSHTGFNANRKEGKKKEKRKSSQCISFFSSINSQANQDELVL